MNKSVILILTTCLLSNLSFCAFTAEQWNVPQDVVQAAAQPVTFDQRSCDSMKSYWVSYIASYKFGEDDYEKLATILGSVRALVAVFLDEVESQACSSSNRNLEHGVRVDSEALYWAVQDVVDDAKLLSILQEGQITEGVVRQALSVSLTPSFWCIIRAASLDQRRGIIQNLRAMWLLQLDIIAEVISYNNAKPE